MTVFSSDPQKKAGEEVKNLLKKAEKLESILSTKNENTDTEFGLRESIKEISSDLSYIARTLFHIKIALLGFYQRFISPILRIASPVFRIIGKSYGKIWRRYAYVKNYSGELVFSKSRSSALIFVTVIFVSIFTPTGLGNAVRFFTIEPIFDGTLMLSTLKTEQFYLYTSEEINPGENIHSVSGCRVLGECSEKDSVYFRVKPRLAHDIWKLLEHSNPIYIPDHVIAPIAPGVNRCMVTYYGYRMTSSWISRLMRSFQVYPTMLEATCEHEGALGKKIA